MPWFKGMNCCRQALSPQAWLQESESLLRAETATLIMLPPCQQTRHHGDISPLPSCPLTLTNAELM